MKQASIEIIQKCPNCCMHCSSCADVNCTEKMDSKLVKRVLNGLKELDVKELSISGGEPFLHEGLVDIIQASKQKGFKVNIYTSGIMLDENNKCTALKNEVLRELHKVGVDKLIFNLQSLKEEVYNEIMGTKGNLSLLKEAIRNSKLNGIYTELHFVPMKLNYTEIRDVIEFVRNEKIDKVSFLGLIPHGRAKENKGKLYLDYTTNQKLKEMLDKISIEEGERVRVGIPLQFNPEVCKCTAGKEKLYIKFDGKVYGCEAFKYIKLKKCDEEVNPDSIYEKDIVDIVKQSKYLRVAQGKIEEELKKVNYKETCPIQKSYREEENDE